MVYDTQNYWFWTLTTVRHSRKQKTQRFGTWICFHPQVNGRSHLVIWVT
jgi:hypothetical protein